MLIGAKFHHLTMIFIFNCLCAIWAIMTLSGCNQTSKNIFSESGLTNSDVTLLWNEIPGDVSYNIYVSKSQGVTKRSGYKIPNVTNPVRINQLEPGKTYYFVVTVVNRSGESEESKELSYYAVADKIGLIYWGNLFDQSIQDYELNTAEIRQEIEATPESSLAEPESVPLGNEALSDKIAGAEAAVIEEDLAENSKPTTVSIETGTDPDLLELDKMRLKAAQMITDSLFYIFFDKNSNELSPRSTEKLDRIYKIMTNSPDAKLTLNGYSDSSGAPTFNQMVSEVRASSVKSYLSGKGINPSRIMALGHGAQKFLASNKSAEGRRLNRRVEIELVIP